MTASGRSRCRTWSPNSGPPRQSSTHCCGVPISQRPRPGTGCEKSSESLSNSHFCRQRRLDVLSRWCWIPGSRRLGANLSMSKQTRWLLSSRHRWLQWPRLGIRRIPCQSHVRHNRRQRHERSSIPRFGRRRCRDWLSIMGSAAMASRRCAIGKISRIRHAVIGRSMPWAKPRDRHHYQNQAVHTSSPFTRHLCRRLPSSYHPRSSNRWIERAHPPLWCQNAF